MPGFEKFAPFNHLYQSPIIYGCDRIIRQYLNLGEDVPLPVTIPHGIDFYHLKIDLDLHCHEPLYMAFNDEVAERVKPYKTVLKFPHPWLFLLEEKFSNFDPKGTLFIAPPPSENDFKELYDKIITSDFEKPWGVLIKDRGATKEDFEWWSQKHFVVHTAGHFSCPDFFRRLRDIFSRYNKVASPNMSSAVIFAASMGLKAYAIPDVCLHYIDTANVQDALSHTEGQVFKVRDTWAKLLSDDTGVAQAEARNLLGIKYMDSPDNLRGRLLEAIKATENKPLDLYPLREGRLYRMLIKAQANGIPVVKLFPNPSHKVVFHALHILRFDPLTYCTGSDFSHYGIVGNSGPLKYRRCFAFQFGKNVIPGQALRGQIK